MNTTVQVADNLKFIQDRIQAAAERVGRSPEEITLIAVSKTKPMELIVQAFEAGQVDFGENKVQEMTQKQPELPQGHWHAIGGLQRNKVKYLAPYVHLIHSLDNQKLMAEINKRAAQQERVIDCLIQINISDEDQKGGATRATAEQLITHLEEYPHVSIKGLMGMAEFTDDTQVIRQQFTRLRQMGEALATHSHPRFEMKELSMGMSGDFEIAIEEGSTMVRVGSAIFGARG
ncbi:MAG: YggS family pyridoxal phosphate-dependent enzyme [Bacteroidota bacterium]